MPRIVSRAAYGWAIALGVLAFSGLGWSWMSMSRASNWLGQAAAAYAQGNFRQASELARSRLKQAPEDQEALRWLARATARLGRDVPANALFARLGSSALQAEDLYLLGIGLSRAGQTEPAGRLWEKGLALEPDHAELIDQLMIRNRDQNRLAEAAHLAERLARQPGWELRGELELATFRAQMSDPAAAVRALRGALERPEASRLDRATAVHFRELLARSLLKIGKPAEARVELGKVLADGPRPEASWLSSRAALQEGAIADAIAALRAAGPYRADHPLELEPGPYLGEAGCARCHADKARAVQRSRHHSTLVRGQALMDLPYPDGIIPDPDDPTVTHAFRREADGVRVQTRIKDKVLSAVADYAFGSPEQYFSLVGHDDRGQPYIFRLSHYRAGAERGWVRTTGHSAEAQGGHDFLGKPIDAVDGTYQCLFCHTTDPRAVLDRSGPVAADRAIGCERCHGPGGNHVLAIEAKLSDPAIINPADATAGGRIRLCGQCHTNHQESSLPRTDPFWLRFQGNTITWSRCYTETAGALDCMTCHDPHGDGHRSPADFNAKCLSCHSGQFPRKAARASGPVTRRARPGATCPVNRADGCIGCHMPSITIKPLHATFSDHYIRIHPDLKPAAYHEKPSGRLFAQRRLAAGEAPERIEARRASE
jgi:tetratricopeptide (TPR) repeat protein